MHNPGQVWLADCRESGRSASSVGPKQNRANEAANSKHKAMLLRGRIVNYTPVINFRGCPSIQQPTKQLQPSAFPSLISGIEKDDSPATHAGAVHLKSVPAGRR